MEIPNETTGGVPARMSREMERILVVGSGRREVRRLEREMEHSGYLLIPAIGARQALEFLSKESAHLILVMAVEGGKAEPPEAKRGSTKEAGRAVAHPKGEESDGYGLCRAVKSAAEVRGIPVVLVASVWGQSALGRGLEAGADYFLFTPYQEQGLLQSIRGAMLNGRAAEPADVLPGVEVIHQDRMYTVTAGRGRLARAIFSIFEELQHSHSAMSWSKAEAGELRRQLEQERQRSQMAQLLPEVIQGIALSVLSRQQGSLGG